MEKLNHRQIIILGAFCLPLIALVARFCIELKNETIPNAAKIKMIATAPPVPNFSGGTLGDEREKFRSLIAEAMKMTPEQYLERQKTDKTFLAPNLQIRRERLVRRLEQLNQMSNEQWDVEQLRQPNVIPKSKAFPVQPKVITVPQLPRP